MSILCITKPTYVHCKFCASQQMGEKNKRLVRFSKLSIVFKSTIIIAHVK